MSVYSNPLGQENMYLTISNASTSMRVLTSLQKLFQITKVWKNKFPIVKNKTS